MKKVKTAYTAIVEKTSTGFSGYFKEIDGVVSVGDSVNELKSSMREALEMYLDFLKEKDLGTITIDDVELNFVIDMKQFFEYFEVINKSAFADYAGINRSLFRQYTKGLTKLSDKKLLVISKGLHKLADDISNMQLAN